MWIRATRTIVGGARFDGLFANVEIANAQIPPNNREVGVEFCASLPKVNGFFMAPSVVKQITKVIGRASITGYAAFGGKTSP